MIEQFWRFSVVGVIGTAVHYIVLIALVQMMNFDTVGASAVGFAAGALVNYSLNYRFTFKSTKRHQEAMLKFFAIAVIGLVLNSSIMEFAVHQLHLHYLVSQIIATALVLIWSFGGNRLWAFREKRL